jgi:hypothetical protein
MSAITEQPPSLDEPKHPLAQLTTYELNAYLRQLQAAVTFFEKTQAPALAVMRDKLAQVLAEQADRKRLADA